MIKQAAIKEWDRRNPQGTPGNQKWPSDDPRWNAQTEEGRRNMIDLRNMVIQGIREAVPRGQNMSKVFCECQGKEESPSEWLGQLRHSLQMHSGTDPTSPIGEILLKTQFVAKSWEDIRRKLEKNDNWQDKSLQELLREAQHTYMRREEEKQKAQAKILVAAVQEAQNQEKPTPAPSPVTRPREAEIPGKWLPFKSRSQEDPWMGPECFYCKKRGHLKRDCRKRIKDEKVFQED